MLELLVFMNQSSNNRLFAYKLYIVYRYLRHWTNLIRPDLTQSDPWMDPIHVQLWVSQCTVVINLSVTLAVSARAQFRYCDCLELHNFFQIPQHFETLFSWAPRKSLSGQFIHFIHSFILNQTTRIHTQKAH